jgi:3-oxoisoapionate decarboxylase
VRFRGRNAANPAELKQMRLDAADDGSLPRLRLGIGSHAYGWAVGVPGSMPPSPMTPFQLLERAQALGVRVVQIADNLPLHMYSPDELDHLASLAEHAGIAIEPGTRGIDPTHLRWYLQLAARFRSPILPVVIDTAEHHPDEDEVVRTLAGLMPEFEDAGVSLAIENHDRFAARTLRRIIERVASPGLGICLDTANSLGVQEGMVHVAETLSPWIMNLHIKDISVKRFPHRMGFHIEGRPAGDGDVAIPGLLEFVRTEVPRRLSVIVELWPPPEDTIQATLQKEAAWVEASVRYLRGFIPD